MKDDFRFDLKVTNICKGVAILIMLIHHIFPGMEGYGLKIGNTWVLAQIAILGKVCVSIFLFLSGYGLQESYSSKKLVAPEFYKKRFLSLYIPYWMVFVIFISIGFLFFPTYLNNFLSAPFTPKKNLLINFLGLQYFFGGYMGINPSWWFFSQIALIYLLYPVLHKISNINKYGSYILCLACFIFSFYLNNISVRGIFVNFMWFTPFIMGMLFSHHKLFVSPPCGRYDVFVCGILILFLSILRIRFGADTKAGLWTDFILAPLSCFFLYRLYNKRTPVTSVIFDILAFLGLHSGNIYYIHLFVTNMYTTPYIYGLNSPFFMVLATIAVCLPFSIVIEKSKRILLYTKLPNCFSVKLPGKISIYGNTVNKVCQTFSRVAFVIISATLIHHSLSPVLNHGIISNIAVYTIGVVLSYLLFPFISGKFYLAAAETTSGKRTSGLDLLRVIAVVLVMLIHYIGAIGYYSWNADSLNYFAVSLLRWFASTCCPLFMLLTGYFAINKKVERKSWSGIPFFLFAYFVLCTVHILYLWYIGRPADWEYIKQLINMNAFWYVNMHFGLMLIIPFCNVLWNTLSCFQKQLLIFILFILSSFGTITNGLFTQYWYGLYPLLYYFIGGFIRQYNIKAERLFAIVFIFLILVLQTTYTYFIADGATFDWIANYGGYSSCYNAAPTVIVSATLMILVKDIEINNKYINYILMQISKNSLIIYLASCMFVSAIVSNIFLPKLQLTSLTTIFLAESAISIIICILIGFVINKMYIFIKNKVIPQ